MRYPGGLTSLVAVLAVVVACVELTPNEHATPLPRPGSTYERVLRDAESGDSVRRNDLGFMLFSGESAPLDRDAAVRWFAASAGQGYVIAQLNLAIAHRLGVGTSTDSAAAERFFRLAYENPERPLLLRLTTLSDLLQASCRKGSTPKSVGQTVYETFCAGCHGVNGIAAFGAAPSFALGERGGRSPNDLMRTVLDGHDPMPRWDDKLPASWLEQALRYAMSLRDAYRWGILHVLQPPPDYYYRFGVMSTDFGGSPTEPSLSYPRSGTPFEELCGLD